MLKKFGVVALVLLSLSVFVACGGAAADEPAPSEEPPAASTAASSEPAAEPAKPAGPLAIGETAQVEDATVTLQGVRAVDEFGTRVTLAEFRVLNTGDDIYNLSTILQFEAFDAAKRKAQSSFSMDQRGSLDTQLQPGQELVGEVAFNLPADAAPYVFRFSRAMGVDMAEWAVPVEAIQ